MFYAEYRLYPVELLFVGPDAVYLAQLRLCVGVEPFLKLRVAVRVYPVELHLFERAAFFYLAAQRREFVVVRHELQPARDCVKRPLFVAEVGAQLGGLKPAPRV